MNFHACSPVPTLRQLLRAFHSLLAACLFVVLHAIVPPAQAAAQPPRQDRDAVPADMAGPQGMAAFSIPDTVDVIRDIAYRDGNDKWKLDLARSKQPASRPQPGLVFIHGGGWSGGDKRSGYFFQGAVDFAQKGYVCVSVNYRLSGEAPFPAAVEDVRTAVRWLRANAGKYNIDPNRIGAYGNSAGAHLAQMLALPEGRDPALDGDGPYSEFSAKIQAACTSATPTNFLTMRQRGPGGSAAPAVTAPQAATGTAGPAVSAPTRRGGETGFLAGSAETYEARAKAASPVNYVTPDDPPVLLIHGNKDGTVAMTQSEELIAKLREAKVRYATLLIVDGDGHGVFMLHRELTIPAMESFFVRTLGAAGAP